MSLISSSTSKSQVSNFNSRVDFRKGQNQNKFKVQGLQCKHYSLKCHAIEKCYKLIEYPKDFNPRNEFNNINNKNK